MTDDELKEIITKLEDYSSDREVRFGYYNNEGHEKKIKANKAGLILAASVLLRSSVDYDSSEQNILQLEDHWIDENADYYFDYIEKTDHIELIQPPIETIKDKLFGLGCITVVVLLIICLIVGVYTVFQWWI